MAIASVCPFSNCNIINTNFQIIYKVDSIIQTLYGVITNLDTKQRQNFACPILLRNIETTKVRNLVKMGVP